MSETIEIQSERLEQSKMKIGARMEELVANRDNVKQRFVERFMANERAGEDTIEWKSDDVILAETKASLAETVLALANHDEHPMDILEAYEKVCNRSKEEILDSCRYRGASRSTNVYANVNEDVKRQAKAQFVEEFRWDFDRMLEIRDNLRKTEENEDIAQVITDLINRTHYQLKRFNNQAETLTVKTKQRVAANKAEAYGDIFNSMMSVADWYGVRGIVEKELEDRDW